MNYDNFEAFETILKEKSAEDKDNTNDSLRMYLTVCKEFASDTSDEVKELKLVLYLYFFGFKDFIGILKDSSMYLSEIDYNESKLEILTTLFKKVNNEETGIVIQNPFEVSEAIQNAIEAIFGRYAPYEYDNLSYSTRFLIALSYCIVEKPISNFNLLASDDVLKTLKQYLLANVRSVPKRDFEIVLKTINYEIPFTNFTDLTYFVIMNDDKKLDQNLFTEEVVRNYIMRYFGIDITSDEYENFKTIADMINSKYDKNYIRPIETDINNFTNFERYFNNHANNLNQLFIHEFHNTFLEYNRSRSYTFMSIDTYNRYSAIINVDNHLNQLYYEILNSNFIQSIQKKSIINTFYDNLDKYKCVFFLMKNREARNEWDIGKDENDRKKLAEEFIKKVPKLNISTFMEAFKKARYDLYNDNLRIIVKNVPDVSDDNDLKGTEYEHFKGNLENIKQTDIKIHFYERLRYFINSDSLTSFFIPIIGGKLRMFPMNVPNYNVENDYSQYFEQFQRDLITDVSKNDGLKYRRISYYRIFLRKGVRRQHLLFLMGCLANGSCNYVKQSQISWHRELGEMLETLPEFFDSDNKDLRCMNCIVVQRRLNGCNHRFHQIVPRIFYNDFIEECRKKYELLEGPIIPVGMIDWRVPNGVSKNMVFDDYLMDFSKDMFESVQQSSIEDCIKDEYKDFLDGNVVEKVFRADTSIFSEQDAKRYLNMLPYSSISKEEFEAFCDNGLIKKAINKNKFRKLNETFDKLSPNAVNEINMDNIITFSEVIFNVNAKKNYIKLQQLIENKPSEENRKTAFMKIFGKICDSYEENHCINDIFNDIVPSKDSKKFSLYNVVRNLSSFIDSRTFFKESYAYCVIRIFFNDIVDNDLINSIKIAYDIRKRDKLEIDTEGKVKMSLLKYDDVSELGKYFNGLYDKRNDTCKGPISSFKSYLKFTKQLHPNLYDHFQNITLLDDNSKQKNVLESLNKHFKECVEEAVKNNVFNIDNGNISIGESKNNKYSTYGYILEMRRSNTEAKNFNNVFSKYFKGYYDTLMLKILLDNSKASANIEYKNDENHTNKTIISVNNKDKKLTKGDNINVESFKVFLDGLRDELLLRKFLFTVNNGYNYFDVKVDYQNIKNPNADNNKGYSEEIDKIMLKHNISSESNNEKYDFNQVAVLLKSFYKIVANDELLRPVIDNTFDINTSDNPKQMLLAIAVIATFTNG